MPNPRARSLGRVLVAEDDTEARELTVQALRSAFPDLTVIEAEDGEAAWTCAAQEGVEVLVADLRMPRLSGLELARRLRESTVGADSYIILTTGVEPSEEFFGGVEELADDFLLKPFRLDELVLRVRVGLRRVTMSRRLAKRAAELEKLYERQSEFLSLVSHEIRTPLAAIQSSANILMRYGSSRRSRWSGSPASSTRKDGA